MRSYNNLIFIFNIFLKTSTVLCPLRQLTLIYHKNLLRLLKFEPFSFIYREKKREKETERERERENERKREPHMLT